MKSIAAAATLLALCACSLGEEELPKVRVRSTPEPCGMPGPPPALVMTAAADPAHCLPQAVRARGLDVAVQVAADGRAIAVEDALDLCLTVGPDGKVVPKHQLSASEKLCILEDLHEWRFVAVESCWPVFAHVSLGGTCPTGTETAEK